MQRGVYITGCPSKVANSKRYLRNGFANPDWVASHISFRLRTSLVARSSALLPQTETSAMDLDQEQKEAAAALFTIALHASQVR